MNRSRFLAAGALFSVLLLAGCGSSGIGDILGGGSNSSMVDLRGTVDSVDTSSRSILLRDVSGSSMLSSGGSGNTARVYYTDQTTVSYQGRSYRPQDLERGDQVDVRADQSGNQIVANSVTVTYDASGGASGGSSYPSYPSGTYNSTIRGTVQYVDASRSTIQIYQNGYSNQPMTLQFNTNTPVYYSGTTYRVTDLERGDEIEIQTRDLGNGQVLANSITVVRSISGGTSGSNTSTNLSTVRGTVRYVDTSRRTIQLDQTTWIAGFRTGTGTTMLVSYDPSVQVLVSGQYYPVANLDPGDIVDVQFRSNGGSNYVAQRITLVRDVNAR